MRILHLLDHSLPLHSGYTFRTRSILRQQEKMGWKTFQLTSAKQGTVDDDYEEIDGLSFFRCKALASWMTRLPMVDQLMVIWRSFKRLLEIAPELNVDVIHAHSPALNGIAAILAGRRLKIPVVYEVRAFWEDAAVDHGTSSEWGLRYRLTRAMETWVLRRASAVTTICDGLRNEMICRGIDPDKITVIPNAVDLNHFDKPQADPDLRAALDLQGCKVLGFVGSFYAYEGLDLLVTAFARLVQQDDSVRLLLVGGGDQEQSLKQQIARLGLQQKVCLAGRVPHSEVGRYYGLIDVLVYPRRNMRLTDLVTPLKPLEAMAQHKLVVASDVGGHKELIKDGVTGLLFKSGDAEALADKLNTTLDNMSSWPQLHRAGYHYVNTERNWPVSVARYLDVYTRAAS